MNNLKNQILNLMQNWFEKNHPVDWESYEVELQKTRQLLTEIYNLVKNYEGE